MLFPFKKGFPWDWMAATVPHVLFPRISKNPKCRLLLSLTSGTVVIIPRLSEAWTYVGVSTSHESNTPSYHAAPKGRYPGIPNTLSPTTLEARWLMHLETRNECAPTLGCEHSACQLQNIGKCVRHQRVPQKTFSNCTPFFCAIFPCFVSLPRGITAVYKWRELFGYDFQSCPFVLY